MLLRIDCTMVPHLPIRLCYYSAIYGLLWIITELATPYWVLLWYTLTAVYSLWHILFCAIERLFERTFERLLVY